MEPIISVEHLHKTFEVPAGDSQAWWQYLLMKKPKTKSFSAVNDVNFSIKKGERVAFIGPNGAGKSTVIKMMSGILTPTSGDIRVLGKNPCKDRESLGYQIGVVFGQKSQLWYHLPAIDTFDLLAKIYDVPQNIYRQRLDELVEVFHLGASLYQTVSKLSLGQRMKCELIASLLHQPDIVFLDEPTIGLDISSKATIRDLVYKRSVEHGTSVFLTSHDVGDMERVCERVIMINHGKIVIDCSLQEMKSRYIKHKHITLMTKDEYPKFEVHGVRIIQSEFHKLVLEVDLATITVESCIREILKELDVLDITIAEPSLEEVIDTIYEEGRRES